MSTPDRRRTDLRTIISALHDSEINGEVSWFLRRRLAVKLGDGANGIDAEAVVAGPEEAAEWLRANAVRHYPQRHLRQAVPALGGRSLAPSFSVALISWLRLDAELDRVQCCPDPSRSIRGLDF
jgi:hypothetical protein